MAEQLDDTATAPSRPSQRPTQASAHDPVGDTIMTPRRVVDLVEPTPSVASRNDVIAAIGVVAPETAAARSGLYSFRIGEHAEPVILDAPTRLGRRPSPPRIPAGVAPRLIRVASPSNEVSASHLEVRQVGSSVIVTDLRSTNGSLVIQPGSVPRKLRQGESVVVSPGALVDIGDGNILQILPMQRLG